MSRSAINPPELCPASNYSHAMVFEGRAVWISGQAPIDAEGRLVGRGDFDAQAAQVLDNLGVALKAAGSDFSRIVRLGILITDRANIPAWRSLRRRHIPEPLPASTLFVCGLVDEDWLLEVEALALVD